MGGRRLTQEQAEQKCRSVDHELLDTYRGKRETVNGETVLVEYQVRCLICGTTRPTKWPPSRHGCQEKRSWVTATQAEAEQYCRENNYELLEQFNGATKTVNGKNQNQKYLMRCLTCGLEKPKLWIGVTSGCLGCGPGRLTQEQAEEHCREYDYDLLETYRGYEEYIDGQRRHIRYWVRCLICGDEHQKKWGSIGSRQCGVCTGRRPRTQEQAEGYCRQYGFDLLETFRGTRGPKKTDGSISYLMRCRVCGYEGPKPWANLTRSECRACSGALPLTPEEAQQRCQDNGFDLLDEWRGAEHRYRMRCHKAGHIRPKFFASVGKTGCFDCEDPTLSTEEVEQRCQDNGYDYLDELRDEKGKRKVRVRCHEAGHPTTKYLAEIATSGCAMCNLAGGTNPSEPQWLYLLERNYEQQFGITENFGERHAEHNDADGDWDVLDRVYSEDGFLVVEIEKVLRNELKERGGRLVSSVAADGRQHYYWERWSTAFAKYTTLRQLCDDFGVPHPNDPDAHDRLGLDVYDHQFERPSHSQQVLSEVQQLLTDKGPGWTIQSCLKVREIELLCPKGHLKTLQLDQMRKWKFSPQCRTCANDELVTAVQQLVADKCPDWTIHQCHNTAKIELLCPKGHSKVVGLDQLRKWKFSPQCRTCANDELVTAVQQLVADKSPGWSINVCIEKTHIELLCPEGHLKLTNLKNLKRSKRQLRCDKC